MNALNKIKKFTDWKNSWISKESLGLIDYISYNIHPEDVIIIGNLFLPELFEIDDFIFLSINFDSDIYNNLKLNNNYKKEEIEKNINRIHLYDIFANCTDSVDESIFNKVGELLRLSWLNHLKNKFPYRKINVELIIDDNEYGPVLVIYQPNF